MPVRLVTVVITSANQARFLNDAVQSVLAQTYPRHEIIVIDNGSHDNTVSIVSRYPTVRFIRFQTNHGTAAACNTGIRHTGGDFVVLLHATDRLLPHHFETALRAFDARPDAALVCGDFYTRRPDGEREYYRRSRAPNPDYYASLLCGNFIGPPAVVMIRRDVLIGVGGLDHAFDGAEDLELYLRIARNHTLACHDDIIAECRSRTHPDWRGLARLLKAHLRALHSQRSFIKGRAEYRAAYRHGIYWGKRVHGDPAFWQLVSHGKAGHWQTALGGLMTLLTSAPTVVLNGLWSKVLAVVAPSPACGVIE